ncbi:MAG: hypothetical protein ACFUZC_15665 [Chthoniobacteraceae bacterium]
MEKAQTFKGRLLQRYPQAPLYVLFTLFSEDPEPRATGPFDFPGEDSIEDFINIEYAAAYPEHALFSLLSESETEGAIPEAVRRFLDEQYDPTVADINPETSPGEEGGMGWLEKPLQLIPSTELPKNGKITIPPSEHPFHVEVKETPAAPPPKGLNRFIKRWIPGGNKDRKAR